MRRDYSQIASDLINFTSASNKSKLNRMTGKRKLHKNDQSLRRSRKPRVENFHAKDLEKKTR